MLSHNSHYDLVDTLSLSLSLSHTHTHTQRLMEFLERVTQHSDTNKMDINNVAMVIAPSLFVALPSRNTFDDVLMAAKTTHVVRLLIKYHPLLWTVSPPRWQSSSLPLFFFFFLQGTYTLSRKIVRNRAVSSYRYNLKKF